MSESPRPLAVRLRGPQAHQPGTAADAFDAATLGGARALGRDDLGRIAPGATADLVLWKAASWTMTPLRDPVKNIVYNATAEDVDRVYVGGRLVVDGGRVLAADEAKILADLQAGGERMWPRMQPFDWAGRTADELSPQTYREWAGRLAHPALFPMVRKFCSLVSANRLTLSSLLFKRKPEQLAMDIEAYAEVFCADDNCPVSPGGAYGVAARLLAMAGRD